MPQLDANNTQQLSLTAEIIADWMVIQLAEQLAVEPEDVEVTTPFEQLGLDSTQGLLIISKAETLCGFKISPFLLWQYPTVKSLSARLIEEFDSIEMETLEI